MITLAELKTAFKDFTYFYGSAPIGTALPYLVATNNGSNNFTADNKVFSPLEGIQLEFYSVSKDETKEGTIEGILDGLDIPYEKQEAFDEDQSFYLTIYTFWR